jgi:uncharacterized protein
VGDRVKVRVLEVDLPRKRIALSIKRATEAPKPSGAPAAKQSPKPAHKSPPPPQHPAKTPFNNPFAKLKLK